MNVTHDRLERVAGAEILVVADPVVGRLEHQNARLRVFLVHRRTGSAPIDRIVRLFAEGDVIPDRLEKAARHVLRWHGACGAHGLAGQPVFHARPVDLARDRAIPCLKTSLRHGGAVMDVRQAPILQFARQPASFVEHEAGFLEGVAHRVRQEFRTGIPSGFAVQFANHVPQPRSVPYTAKKVSAMLRKEAPDPAL